MLLDWLALAALLFNLWLAFLAWRPTRTRESSAKAGVFLFLVATLIEVACLPLSVGIVQWYQQARVILG